MRRYEVNWSKTYYRHGTEIVEAEDEDKACKIILDKLGDLEGSLQYDPNDDYVEAFYLDTQHEESEG